MLEQELIGQWFTDWGVGTFAFTKIGKSLPPAPGEMWESQLILSLAYSVGGEFSSISLEMAISARNAIVLNVWSEWAITYCQW